MATFSWPITVNGKVFTEAMFTPWNYVTALPDLIGNFVDYAQSADAATKAADAKASADAAAAALAQAQGLIPQITTGSTNSLAYPEQIKNLITANDIVDVFVYDTRFDSDGGAWTEQCQHASWYQEALGTATRGVKRAFPKVAILIARTNSFAIYDALDLDGTGAPRMWMLFNAGNAIQSGGISSVAALNGQIVLGMAAANIIRIDFPKDLSAQHATSISFRVCNIANRNTATTPRKIWNSSIPSAVNDVAMRVLPGAPIDPVTGLPIPTILIAGNTTGTTILHPDDRVSTITDAGGHHRVAFLSDTYIAVTRGASPATHIGPIFYGTTIAHTSWNTRQFGSNTALAIPGTSNAFRHFVSPNGAVGSALGLTFFAHDFGNLNNGMNAQAHTSHATGWMPGDIRGAWLCDNTTGAVSAANVYANDGTSTVGLSPTNGATVVSNAGRLEITNSGGTAGGFSVTIPTITGRAYSVRMNAQRLAGAATFFGVDLGVGVIPISLNPPPSVATDYFGGFTATGSSTVLTFRFGGASNTTSDVLALDNISIDLAVADRSYRSAGLTHFGTLTGAAVATGADISAFSGFSAANYLEQPYTANLDFADADFAIIGWLQRSATTAAEVLLERDSAVTGPRFTLMLDNSTSQLRFTTDDDADVVAVATSQAPDDGFWHQFVCVMRGNTQELWVDGALVATADATAVGTLSNAAAVLRLGCDVAGTMPFGGSLALVRATAYAPTKAQIERMFFDERQLFEAGAKAFIGGTAASVVAVDFSRMSGRVAAATGDGVSIYSGLRRVEYLDAAVAAGAIANDAMRAVSIESGMVAFGTTANAGMRRDAIIALDRMPASAPAAAGRRRFTAQGVTTDATPLVLAPRIHVGERETLLVEAVIVGRVYGTADGQRAAYVRRAIAYRDTAGNITLQGSVQTIGTDTEVTGTADATLVVDTTSNTIGAQVTGIAATRMPWHARFSITRISDVAQYEEVA